ncbi:hypothetical protein PGUG_00116 [Meyerozyma guilliermondii ATCC 6260]|uniref:Uncharacterized protein n=1 Tax=Meyerozyma guilliermondii (strain ATCC 6260 / CBS 566 / DSM 6381 / JCM 1539 / NBRC 10279 / NRRL Y-324) TaxID=294746 RepID=A5DA11_PICGU|nr:uncharacterized protein PGUG_00116 [Meyerozyma guilliermondii ATCC 6260]EDK36018.1 hypothetical protein PGUG_00116 [Meyerozyma guilliermondii ATCC 6260]
MHCTISNIRAYGTGLLIPTILIPLPNLTEMFLFVSNKMAYYRHNSSILHSFDCRGSCSSLKIWVGAKTFPVPPSSSLGSDGANSGSQYNIHPFTPVFKSDCFTPKINQAFIKRGTSSKPRRKMGHKIGIPYSVGSILKAKIRDPKPRYRSGISDAWPRPPPGSGC